MQHEPLRYAHEEGHTDVCFSSDGSKFITCGADGDIRIWSTNESEDPIHNCIGEFGLSVAQKGDNLYVATGNNDVQILTFPEGNRNGVLHRSVAPINQIAISGDSDHIALAGEAMEVKLIDLSKAEREIIVFDGLKGPCLSVAVNSKYLASSSGDGKLRIWNIDNKELLKEEDCFPKVNSLSNAKCLCRLDFQPNHKKFLAYPEKETVVLLEVLDWSKYTTLKCDKITAEFSIVQFSPCGNYLVATSLEGDVVIFNINTKTVTDTSKHPNSTPICGLMWNPNGNGQIVYTDTEGQLSIISGCVATKPIGPEEGFVEHSVDFGDVQFEDDDEDGENVISVEKLKKEVMGDVESELNFGSSRAPTPRPKTPEIPLQPPFMPSSTPEHLNPRYLCWNEVAVIRSYGSATEDESEKSIEIEFHDSTLHNSMTLQNYQDYTLASVSKTAVAVASAVRLCVIPLNATSKEWTLKLEESPEEIVLITASEDMICFGTNNYLVRVCSVFGTQRAVVAMPGPLVSMASYKNDLLVAYHCGGVRQGDQCINVKLISFKGLAMESRDIGGALGPESTLTWLGFSDSGNPAMVSSLGMLSLYPKTCNCWIPFCDNVKHVKNPSDGFFVTAVFESCQTVLGIKCRGSVYPGFIPRPTVCELPLEPPFAEATTEKTQLEMNLFTWTNLEVKDVNKKFVEAGLKTFALACKNSLDQRAVELMEILANPVILSLSTKYAAKMNKKVLAEKLMEMARKIMDDEEELSLSFLDRSVATPVSKEPPKRLTLSSIKKTPKSIKPLDVSTPSVISQESVLTATTFNESDISIAEPTQEPKNPFLKSTNGEKPQSNPLSLTNKFAGVEHPKPEIAEKRKQPDSETEKPKEKQRKMDRFLFGKRS